MAKGTCSIEGCEKSVVVKSRGWCTTHYQRWKRHGDPNAKVRLWGAPLADRLLAGCEVNAEGCWLWNGALQKDGYGIIGIEGSSWLVHRAAYLAWNGPLDPDKEIDHTCRVRRCINPLHLEQVTHPENIERARPYRARKTHCPQGHPYDEENTRYNKVGARYCIICQRAAGRKSDRKRYAKHGNRRGADR